LFIVLGAREASPPPPPRLGTTPSPRLTACPSALHPIRESTPSDVNARLIEHIPGGLTSMGFLKESRLSDVTLAGASSFYFDVVRVKAFFRHSLRADLLFCRFSLVWVPHEISVVLSPAVTSAEHPCRSLQCGIGRAWWQKTEGPFFPCPPDPVSLVQRV